MTAALNLDGQEGNVLTVRVDRGVYVSCVNVRTLEVRAALFEEVGERPVVEKFLRLDDLNVTRRRLGHTR